MYKKVTEDLVKEKVAEILKEGHHWQRVCLLILLLMPLAKRASKYYIYDKIQEWTLLDLPRVSTLLAISKALHDLLLAGYLRKEDLIRRSLSQKEFEKICKNKVLGRPEHLKLQEKVLENPEQLAVQSRWIHSAYYLSPEGRKLARSILFPPRPRKKRSSHNHLHWKREGENQKSSACA